MCLHCPSCDCHKTSQREENRVLNLAEDVQRNHPDLPWIDCLAYATDLVLTPRQPER